MHWLESESSDGAVQVTEVIHLEYIKPLPPFVVLDAEDAFDFAPTSIFFRISFENGYITLCADCSALGIEIGEHIDQTSKQAENKKRSAPPSNEVSGKTCKRTANDKRTALTTLISDALLPGEESKFLARKGTRHYARLCSAKSLGSLLYISNTAKKVPRYCFSCKSAEFQFVYYVPQVVADFEECLKHTKPTQRQSVFWGLPPRVCEICWIFSCHKQCALI